MATTVVTNMKEFEASLSLAGKKTRRIAVKGVDAASEAFVKDARKNLAAAIKYPAKSTGNLGRSIHSKGATEKGTEISDEIVADMPYAEIQEKQKHYFEKNVEKRIKYTRIVAKTMKNLMKSGG